MSDMGFSIDGWAEFVENFAQFVDMWEAKRMGNIYLSNVLPFVPVDTSRLVDNIFLFTDGIPQDYVEVGTNVKYALYVDEGHVQHRRFLPADKLSVGGRAKYLKSRDYLIAGYTRQIKIPYVSGVTVDTTQNDPFGSVDAQGQYHDPDTRVSTQAKITYIDGLKKGDLVAVQKLNDTNKFVILARVKEA